MTQIDLRIIKTLENIDNALLNNLDTLPFSKITVDILCKTAKINRSTFYKYYKDKYDLLENYLSRILNEFSNYVKADFIIATAEQLETLVYSNEFKSVLIFFYNNKSTYKILWKAVLDRQVYNEMISIIQHNILENLTSTFNINSKQSKYASLFSYLFASNVMAVVSWWFDSEEEISLEEVSTLMHKNTSKGLFITLKELIN